MAGISAPRTAVERQISYGHDLINFGSMYSICMVVKIRTTSLRGPSFMKSIRYPTNLIEALAKSSSSTTLRNSLQGQSNVHLSNGSRQLMLVDEPRKHLRLMFAARLVASFANSSLRAERRPLIGISSPQSGYWTRNYLVSLHSGMHAWEATGQSESKHT